MSIRWVDETDFDFADKRVFCRVDFNVPMDEQGRILDDARIRAAVPTIKFLVSRGAKVVVGSHLGRPGGKFRKNLSLEPVAERLLQMLSQDVVFVEDCVGEGMGQIIAQSKPGSVVLLENLRFHSGEEKNDDTFAKKLSQNIDAYVDDAFGAIHRAHASVHALPLLLEHKFGGLLLKEEVAALQRLNNPERPFVAVLGGAKVSDKIGLIGQLLNKTDVLIIGGAMAYTFLKAQGYDVGQSRFEADRLQLARGILQKAQQNNVKIILPVDHVVMTQVAAGSPTEVVKTAEFRAQQSGVDIGPLSQALFAQALAGAQTVFWNGPMGIVEWPSCSQGTLAVINAIADASGFKVAGGGDSLAALKKSKRASSFSHISTGGGASLEFIEGAKLPGMIALGYEY